MVRSTQTVEQNASDSTGGSQAAVSVANALPGGNANTSEVATTANPTSGRTEETTNYEISKKVTTSTEDGGEVKRLSVAVVVDGTRTGDGPEAAYKPRTAAEMTQIINLVKSTMGFRQARGDQVQVSNMEFARVDAGEGTPAPKPFLGLDGAYWFKIIEAGIMCLTALLIGLFVARPLINRMFAPNASGQPLALPGLLSSGRRAAGARARRDDRHGRIGPASAPARAPARHRSQPHRRPGPRILGQEDRRSGERPS